VSQSSVVESEVEAEVRHPSPGNQVRKCGTLNKKEEDAKKMPKN